MCNVYQRNRLRANPNTPLPLPNIPLPLPVATNPKRSYVFYWFICYFSSLLFMLGLVFVRNSRRMLHDNEESFLEDNHLFMIIAVVAACIAESTTLVLIYSNYYRGWRMTRDIHHVYIKRIGCISAVLAAFSVMMVVLLPPKFNWIGVTGGCIICGLVFAVCCWDDRNCKSSGDIDDVFYRNLAGVVLVYVPLSLVMVLLVPMDQNWIVYPTLMSFAAIIAGQNWLHMVYSL